MVYADVNVWLVRAYENVQGFCARFMFVWIEVSYLKRLVEPNLHFMETLYRKNILLSLPQNFGNNAINKYMDDGGGLLSMIILLIRCV